MSHMMSFSLYLIKTDTNFISILFEIDFSILFLFRLQLYYENCYSIEWRNKNKFLDKF